MALLQDDGDDGADDDGVDDDDYGSGDDDDDDGSAETQHWGCNVLCFYRKSLALNSLFPHERFFLTVIQGSSVHWAFEIGTLDKVGCGQMLKLWPLKSTACPKLVQCYSPSWKISGDFEGLYTSSSP